MGKNPEKEAYVQASVEFAEHFKSLLSEQKVKASGPRLGRRGFCTSTVQLYRWSARPTIGSSDLVLKRQPATTRRPLADVMMRRRYS